MKIKDICITAMGVALFVALSMCLRVPVFENYYLCLGYIVMAVYCYIFGPVKGTIVGVFGTILYCFLINGLRDMPGWALGNIVIGVIMGLWFKYSKKQTSLLHTILSIIVIVAAVALGILGVKSAVECFLYAQPMIIRLANNVYAFVSDVVVAAVALGILGVKSAVECFLYAQPMIIRLANNVYAFVSDVVVLVASLPICKRISTIKKGVVR